jgi:hypothetical protein
MNQEKYAAADVLLLYNDKRNSIMLLPSFKIPILAC